MDRKLSDPTPDIYKIMDRAGLDSANVYNAKKSMAKIINEIRTSIATQTAE